MSNKIKLSRDVYAVHIILLCICFFPVILSFLLLTDGSGISIKFFSFKLPIRIPCTFKTMTGYNCPTCGMTRSFVFMGSGKILNAINQQKAGVLIYIYCWFQSIYSFIVIFKVKIPYKLDNVLQKIAIYYLIMVFIVMMFVFIKQFF